ncbi:hypothetical protein [Corynebacterium mayonis]|uniref:hypothetical protein n=1 Tax=Corynebacterium mayonis TaxID=3062461 RepID=UPI003140299D
MRPKTLFASAAVVAALGFACAAPAAHAQLFEGMSPQQIKEQIPSTIEVNAGETVTVDIGIALNASYSAEGWNVVSRGTTVSVTAPDVPGATATVPVSAGGHTATVTLVAVGGGAANPAENPAENPAPTGGSEGPQEAVRGDNTAPAGGTGAQESGEGANNGANVTHPQRQPAAPVDISAATELYFDGTIEGNVLSVKVSLSQVSELMGHVATHKEGATLRYVDINGQIIEGVEREIDKLTRTMTLTYPEGETPDNPFILEVVRGGSAEFIAVITAVNAPLEVATNPASPYAKYGADPSGADQAGASLGNSASTGSKLGPILVGAAALVLLAGALLAAVRRRRKK